MALELCLIIKFYNLPLNGEEHDTLELGPFLVFINGLLVRVGFFCDSFIASQAGRTLSPPYTHLVLSRPSLANEETVFPHSVLFASHPLRVAHRGGVSHWPGAGEEGLGSSFQGWRCLCCWRFALSLTAAPLSSNDLHNSCLPSGPAHWTPTQEKASPRCWATALSPCCLLAGGDSEMTTPPFPAPFMVTSAQPLTGPRLQALPGILPHPR